MLLYQTGGPLVRNYRWSLKTGKNEGALVIANPQHNIWKLYIHSSMALTIISYGTEVAHLTHSKAKTKAHRIVNSPQCKTKRLAKNVPLKSCILYNINSTNVLHKSSHIINDFLKKHVAMSY